MSGPHSIEVLENEIYELVISSKARTSDAFPIKYVWLNMEKKGYTKDDFVRSVESFKSKGLITEDEIISDNFFN